MILLQGLFGQFFECYFLSPKLYMLPYRFNVTE